MRLSSYAYIQIETVTELHVVAHVRVLLGWSLVIPRLFKARALNTTSITIILLSEAHNLTFKAVTSSRISAHVAKYPY